MIDWLIECLLYILIPCVLFKDQNTLSCFAITLELLRCFYGISLMSNKSMPDTKKIKRNYCWYTLDMTKVLSMTKLCLWMMSKDRLLLKTQLYFHEVSNSETSHKTHCHPGSNNNHILMIPEKEVLQQFGLKLLP